MNPIYNFPSNPSDEDRLSLWLQLLIDSGEDLDQLGIKMTLPGFRFSESETRRLAKLIIACYLDLYRETPASPD